MKSLFFEQVIPIFLTALTFVILSLLFFGYLNYLNILHVGEKLQIVLRKRDILIGLTIYIKTSIDFAIFMGSLMKTNPGWKKRIAIELGTATGHALGTIIILTIWVFLKEVPVLMAIMIILASLFLLRMAEESIEQFMESQAKRKHIIRITSFLHEQLSFVNKLSKPLLGKLVPNGNIMDVKKLSFFNLVLFSLLVPFILGLDDFAGYIPMFSIVNVFGFAIGAFLAHMLLNIGLFLSPRTTTNLVKNPAILGLGGLVFIGIALWGFYEVIKLIFI